MVTVHLVRCTNGIGKFVPGGFYLHKVSKKGNHLVKINGKVNGWKSIMTEPKLIIDWKHRLFKAHFEIIGAFNVKNHKEADTVGVCDFNT